jgi:hypothetical protein
MMDIPEGTARSAKYAPKLNQEEMEEGRVWYVCNISFGILTDAHSFFPYSFRWLAVAFWIL